MQVQKTTIESLFTHERRYLVPLFQRPYVWTQTGQWEPLWEDLQDLAEGEIADNEQSVRPHFMGAIVLQPRAVHGDHLPVLDVIDGQQRLTTLQLLLVVLRDLASAYQDAAIERWCRSRTENGNALVDEEIERYKVWPTQKDRAQFKEVFDAGSREAIERKYPAKIGRRRAIRPVMIDAYVFFHSTMQKWLEAGAEPRNRLRSLRLALQRRLEIVQIDLDMSENPQEIFETLNARGVPLLASDLLRNFIFQRAKSPIHADELHQRYWTRFEVPNDESKPEGQRFWEVEERQGRLSRARLDLYVQHYLAMKLERVVKIGELFKEYKDWIGKQAPFQTIENELEEFGRYADSFAGLIRADDLDTPFGQFAVALSRLGINSVYPLVLGLLGDTAIPEAERSGILVDIESFLVRRTICQRPTNSYTRKFLELLRDFRAGGERTRSAFQALLGRSTGDIVFDWPSDADFEAAWTELDAYQVLGPGRVELVLQRIERASRSPKSEPIRLVGQLSIEHVMPQAWAQHWPLPEGVDPDLARQKREEVIHDFGNLTLTTQGLNSSLSNGPAADKLVAILEHSNLQLSRWFHGRTSWTEEDIQERGRALFKVALRVWPRPTEQPAVITPPAAP